jgi:hypothetical protein
MAVAVGIPSSPSGTQSGYEHALLCVTEVTFTYLLCSSSIQFVRGSSGGGLPRRPERCSGRFFILGEKPIFRREKHGCPASPLLRPYRLNRIQYVVLRC